jgi:DNA-binding MarR family transcriptional regulator
MSRESGRPVVTPFIALVYRTFRALESDMVDSAHRAGYPGIKRTHNAVFATLHSEGLRAVDMAARMGITRQSMGEIVREMVDLGILQMSTDPTDRRAKLVSYSDLGLRVAASGFSHIQALDRRFTAEFGRKDYATARRVLERVAEMLEEDAAGQMPPPSTRSGARRS